MESGCSEEPTRLQRGTTTIEKNCGEIDTKCWTRGGHWLTLKTDCPREVSMQNQSEATVSVMSPRPPNDESTEALLRRPPRRVGELESLLTAEDVAKRLNVSTDWVWDHSSRKKPLLPVIRMGDGALRYRAHSIEEFIDERERLSALRRRA